MKNQKIENILTNIMIVSVVLILLASLVVPVILAVLCEWKWLLLYPVMLVSGMHLFSRKK